MSGQDREDFVVDSVSYLISTQPGINRCAGYQRRWVIMIKSEHAGRKLCLLDRDLGQAAPAGSVCRRDQRF